MIVGFITMKRSSWNQMVSAPKPRTRMLDIHSIGEIRPSFHFEMPIATRIATMKAIVPLIAPAVAMQFTAEVNWGPGDFVVAAGLLGLTGLGLELAARASLSRMGKVLAAGAIVLALLVVWAELAVGLFD